MPRSFVQFKNCQGDDIFIRPSAIAAVMDKGDCETPGGAYLLVEGARGALHIKDDALRALAKIKMAEDGEEPVRNAPPKRSGALERGAQG